MHRYHYSPKKNSILSAGVLSFAKNPKADIITI